MKTPSKIRYYHKFNDKIKHVAESVYDMTIKETVVVREGDTLETLALVKRKKPIRYVIVELLIQEERFYGIARCSDSEERYDPCKGRDIARTRALHMHEHIMRGVPELMTIHVRDNRPCFIPALVGTMPLNPIVINKIKEICNAE